MGRILIKVLGSGWSLEIESWPNHFVGGVLAAAGIDTLNWVADLPATEKKELQKSVDRV